MSITYQKNALIENGAAHITINEPKTINEVIKEIDRVFPDSNISKTELRIAINGIFPDSVDAKQFKILPTDVVTLMPGFAGGSSGGQSRGAKIAITAVAIAAIVGSAFIGGAGLPVGLTLLAQAGVLVGSQLIILGIRALGRQDQNKAAVEKENQVGYSSITNGANQYRVDEPQNLILSARQNGVPIYPPYDTNPYYTYELYKIQKKAAQTVNLYLDVPVSVPDFAIQPDTVNTDDGDTIQVGLIAFFDIQPAAPVFFDQGSGTLWVSKALPNPTDIEGFGMPGILHTQGPFTEDFFESLNEALESNANFFMPVMVQVLEPGHPCFNQFVSMEELIQSNENATCIDNVGNLAFFPCYYRETKDVFIYDKREFVSAIYNIGYGCAEYAEERFGPKLFNQMRYSSRWQNDKTALNWPMFSQPAVPNPAGVIANKEFNTVEGRVFQTDAGELHNRGDLENFITEVGQAVDPNALQTDGTYFLEADIEGYGYRNAPTEYQPVERLISPSFTDLIAGSGGPLESCNGDPTPGSITMINIQRSYRDTLFADRAGSLSKYQMILGKLSPDDEDKDTVFNLAWKRAKFYQTDINTNYKMINRIATKVSADDQKSGRPDRFNVDVRAKMWICDVDAGTWTWGFSTGQGTNPADVWLYYVLGGYENQTAAGPGSFAGFPNSDTIGWTTGQHPENGKLRWGLGQDPDCIDYNILKNWARYCRDQKLYCDFVLERRMNEWDALDIILSTGRASTSFASGKMAMVWEDPLEPVSYMFNDSNIIKDSLKVETLADGFPDLVRCAITNSDPDSEGSEDIVESVMPFVEPSQCRTEARINLIGVPNRYNAQRECNLFAAKNRYQRRIFNWQSREGILVTRGCVVMFNHSRFRYAESGRGVYWVKQNGFFESVKINQEICIKSWTHVTILGPTGYVETMTISIVDDMIVFDDPIPCSQGPARYNQCSENPESVFENSTGQDFIFQLHFGDMCRRLRITRVDYGNIKDGIVTITAVPEEPAVHLYEFNNIEGLNGEPPAPADIEPFDDCNKPYPKIFGAKAIHLGAKLWCIEFKIQEAAMATVSAVLDGAPAIPLQTQSGYTVFGNRFCYEFEPNTMVELTISPVAIGPFFAIEPETISFST